MITPRSSKIRPDHFDRKAFVYVGQSIACRHHYPGGAVGCISRRFPDNGDLPR
jgi:hypothetical protein